MKAKPKNLITTAFNFFMASFFSFSFISGKIFSSRKILFFLVLANLVGAFYGFVFYYGKKFFLTPLHLWLFVPDCPLFSFLFAFSVFLVLMDKEKSFLFFFTLAGSLKYGFWTVFVLLFFSGFYFTPENHLMYSVLLVAHVFLFVESFLLIKKIKFKLFYLVPSLLFFVANDLSDYFLDTHPPLPESELNFMFYFTLLSSLAFVAFALLLVKKAKSP
jgi:uncharacterized membrane protein YpjA